MRTLGWALLVGGLIALVYGFTHEVLIFTQLRVPSAILSLVGLAILVGR